MEDLETGNRILVLGCSGSGKSTFSKTLHEQTGLPLFHLDNLWWNEDRSHISRDEFDKKLETILAKDKWIIDGDYSRTYEMRIRSCDTIIFLDFSEKQCMEGIINRVGKTRTDIPWVENQLDPELVELVRNYNGKNRPVLYSLIEKYPDKKVIIFNTREQAQNWLSKRFKNKS